MDCCWWLRGCDWNYEDQTYCTSYAIIRHIIVFRLWITCVLEKPPWIVESRLSIWTHVCIDGVRLETSEETDSYFYLLPKIHFAMASSLSSACTQNGSASCSRPGLKPAPDKAEDEQLSSARLAMFVDEKERAVLWPRCSSTDDCEKSRARRIIFLQEVDRIIKGGDWDQNSYVNIGRSELCIEMSGDFASTRREECWAIKDANRNDLLTLLVSS